MVDDFLLREIHWHLSSITLFYFETDVENIHLRMCRVLFGVPISFDPRRVACYKLTGKNTINQG